MTDRGLRWVILAVLLAAATTLLADEAVEDVRNLRADGAAAVTEAAADTVPPTPTTSTPTTVTTTTIPEIEALIPLSVDALAEDVADSVGFVLSQQGTGSGVVISEDYLVTNAHVTWPDRTVSLVFRNGATFQGRVVGLDPFVDLAVVDISRLTRKPPPIAIGSLDGLEVGDELFVIGYPAPDEFTPEPIVDAGEILGFSDWEFTGVDWLTIGAPAIGGQSGGAVVDEYGRIVGISTFGSAESLTSIAIDDVLIEVERLIGAREVRGLEPRLIPHSGARRSNDVALEGAWDQQLLFGWFLADADVAVDWVGGSGELTASTVYGDPLARGAALDFVPAFAFPVVIAAESAGPADGTLESSLPLIVYEDPDHGQILPRRGMTAGVYEVGGDRDFFYLDLVEGETVSVTVESAARTRLRVYGPDGEVLGEDVDFSGFIGSNATIAAEVMESGRHIVAIESSQATVAGYMLVTQ